MKKNNNKGFTLIELLAVIVILLLITAIAIPSISGAIERNKSNRRLTQITVIESYAEMYYENHKNSYKLDNTLCISLDKLDLSEKEKEDPYGKLFNGVVEYSNNKFVYNDNKNKCN